MEITDDYCVYKLKDEFSRRQKFNENYSLRAYARDLEIDSSNLSAILKSKRRIPSVRINQMALKLELDERELALFKSTAQEKNSKLDKLKPKSMTKNFLLDEIYSKVISEWEYFAILNLVKLKDFKSDNDWIAKRLGLETKNVDGMVDHLFELGLLKKNKNGEYERQAATLQTSENVSSKSLQNAHLETLELAKLKLKEVSVENRDYSYLTLAINKNRITEARALIRDFQDRLMVLFDTDKDKEEVYSFACQLFPMTKIQESNDE